MGNPTAWMLFFAATAAVMLLAAAAAVVLVAVLVFGRPAWRARVLSAAALGACLALAVLAGAGWMGLLPGMPPQQLAMLGVPVVCVGWLLGTGLGYLSRRRQGRGAAPGWLKRAERLREWERERER